MEFIEILVMHCHSDQTLWKDECLHCSAYLNMNKCHEVHFMVAYSITIVSVLCSGDAM